MVQDSKKSLDFHRILKNSIDLEGHMNAWDIKREMAIPIWQERIKTCRASGMSIDLWCAANNISRKTYYRWEKICVARAIQDKEERTAETCNEHAMIKIDPMTLSNNMEGSERTMPIAPAELVIRCGCVSMDISPEMSVTRIAELVAALNRNV